MDQFGETIKKTTSLPLSPFLFSSLFPSIIICNNYIIRFIKQKLKQRRLINVQRVCYIAQIGLDAKMFMRQQMKNVK